MHSITRFAALAALLYGSTATAELSANAGWVSDYYFRGLPQHASSASAGIDYTARGFYAGAWGADVGDGLEVDGYFGYAGDAGAFTYSVGYTGYFYTGDFDDTYQEINFGGGVGLLSLEVALGEYDNFEGPTQDYAYVALTLEKNGLYGKVAGFSRDFDHEYLELGYAFGAQDIDFQVSLIVADGVSGGTDEALVFGIGKSFQLD